MGKPKKRYMMKVDTEQIFTYSALTMKKRRDMEEVSEATALWKLGTGPKPQDVNDLQNLSTKLLGKLRNLDVNEQEELALYLQKKQALPMLDVPTAGPPQLDQGEVGEIKNTGVPQEKDKPENVIGSLDKPVAKMNKAELLAHAMLELGADLSEEPTNDAIRSKIDELEKAAA